MANRVLQQKRVKMKRMRRAWAKSFSMKNTGPHKHPGYLNDKGDFVDIGFSSRAKAGGMFLDEHLLVKYKFKTNSPEAVYARTRGLHTDLAVDREVILAKQVKSSNNAGSLQGELRYVYAILKKEINYEARLYMCGDSCFIAEEMNTKTHHVSKISMEYSDKHRAKDCFVNHRVVWDNIERVPLLPPESDADPESG